MNAIVADIAPANSAGCTPLRRPNSVRRTSCIATHWPNGFGTDMVMEGYARDALTIDPAKAPTVLAEGSCEAILTPLRLITALSVSPPNANAYQLVGCRAGGHLRGKLAEHMPEERANATPLYLLLDDLSGASLVAGWAWSRWIDEWTEKMREKTAASTAGKDGQMEGICSGFRPGSSALRPDGWGRQDIQSAAPVGPLVNPDDPEGWHELKPQDDVGKRRARWIDCWLEGGKIMVESGFQDSATSPNGGREAIHEYRLIAVADAATGLLERVNVDPRVLPYKECPTASGNVGVLLGTPIGDLRDTVLERLRGTAGCTHLNDMLRNLAEVPKLIDYIPDWATR